MGPRATWRCWTSSRSPIDLSKQGVAGRQCRARATCIGTAAPIPPTAVDGYPLRRPRHLPARRDRAPGRPGARPRGQGGQGPQGLRGDHAGPPAWSSSAIQFAATPGGAVETRRRPAEHRAARPLDRELEIDGYDDPAGELDFQVEDFVPQRLAVTTDGRGRRCRCWPTETRQVARQRPLPLRRDRRRPADPGRGAAASPTPTRSRPSRTTSGATRPTPFDEKLVDLGATVTDGAGPRAACRLAGDQAGDTDQSAAGRWSPPRCSSRAAGRCARASA